MAFTDKQVKEGEYIWRNDASARRRFPDLEALVSTVPAELAATQITEADALTAYLRRHPEVTATAQGPRLDLARDRLAASLKAYAAGDRKAAADLALSAHLDGFEPIEPVLATRDPELVARIEEAMIQLRSAIGSARPLADVEAANRRIVELLVNADAVLFSGQASTLSSFVGAFGILLREGLEALLVVVAMIAFLRKTERTDSLGFVHAGWASALAAGIATWLVATYFISIRVA